MDVLENILRIKDRFLELIFPPRCIFCSDVVPVGENVCCECLEKVSSQKSVRTILEWGGENINCISPFRYSGKVKEAIWRFKFRGQKHYSEYFAKSISRELSGICKDLDIVTAVPLSKCGLRERGYNQSECLARSISKNLELRCENLLIKSKENFPQHELTHRERIENVKGVYKVLNIQNIRNKNILLCDDVVTTGSTLRECVKILKLYGARSVMCCTIAYV